MVFTVGKERIIVVFLGNGAALSKIRAPVTYIRCVINLKTTFPFEFRTGLVTGRAGPALDPTIQYLVADIDQFTCESMDAMVLFVVEQPISGTELRQPIFTDFLGYRSGILTQVSGNVFEGNVVVQ